MNGLSVALASLCSWHNSLCFFKDPCDNTENQARSYKIISLEDLIHTCNLLLSYMVTLVLGIKTGGLFFQERREQFLV